MPWKVRFRGITFTADDTWDPEFEFNVRESLTDRRDLSGSASIVVHADEDDIIQDVTIAESANPDALPFECVHGRHAELGEVFIFYGVPDEDEGQVYALYENSNWGDQPYNKTPYKGDGT